MPVESITVWGMLFGFLAMLIIPIVIAVAYINEEYQSRMELGILAIGLMYLIIIVSWYLLKDPLIEKFQIEGLFGTLVLSLILAFAGFKMFLFKYAAKHKITKS